jgi:hypothetical protein
MKRIFYPIIFSIFTICGCEFQSAKEKELQFRINQLEQKEKAISNKISQDEPQKQKSVEFKMSVSEMIRLLKMNKNQFEKFAINIGFSYISENPYEERITYGIATEGKYLNAISGREVVYQTFDKIEYSKLKNQFKEKGFLRYSGHLYEEIEEPEVEESDSYFYDDSYRLNITVIESDSYNSAYLFTLRPR